MNGFTPWAERATESKEGRALLAEILPAELEAANITSRVLYGRDVDQLDASRLRRVVSDVKYTRREKMERAAPGHCWQCGCSVAAGGRECRPCHEGMTPAQYARSVGRQFIQQPTPLPRWVR